MIGTLDTARREVTIIGAGVSGMLAAYALDKKGYRVTLVEEKAKAGGLIQTRRTAYGMAETAAHSLLATPEVFALCEELGVELAEVRRDSRARFIVRGGRLRKFPLSAGEAVRTFARAAFARRFHLLIGEPPLAYLTHGEALALRERLLALAAGSPQELPEL